MFYREFAKRAQEEGWAVSAALLFFGVMLLFAPGAAFTICGTAFLIAHRIARDRSSNTGEDRSQGTIFAECIIAFLSIASTSSFIALAIISRTNTDRILAICAAAAVAGMAAYFAWKRHHNASRNGTDGEGMRKRSNGT